MKRISNIRILMAGAAALMAASAFAKDVPEIITVPPLYGGGLNNMSANGNWAVGEAVNPGNSSFMAFPRIVNTATGETMELFDEDEAQMSIPMGAACVSDDGKTVGGSYQGYPAVWREGVGWAMLPTPSRNYNMGLVSAITPDGRYAVGRASIDLFYEKPCLWDLNTNKLVELPGMVTSNPRYKDMIEQGGNPSEWTDDELNVRLTGITPDGKILLGMVDFAFPAATWQFLYYVDKGEWQPLGMKYENGRLYPLNSNVANAEECVFSADGKYIGGLYAAGEDIAAPFACSTSAPTEFSLHPDGEGFGVWAVGSDGVLYGSTPLATPIRDWSAKVGNYWYDWKMVLRQLYGIDWMKDITNDDMGLSGTVGAVSLDNRKILATDWAQNISYIITLPQPLSELCGSVDLLGDYKVFPASGAEFSLIQSIVVDFGRNVEICGQKTDASLLDADGKKLRASLNLSTQADNCQRVEVIFRDFSLEPGKDYTVVIPAGVINVAGDAERTNSEIRIRYRGREAGPVRPVAFSPEDGSSVARINLTTNPVTVRFNATLTAGKNPDIRLIQIKDGVEEFLYSLNASVSDREVMIYPVSEQRLAEGTAYRIDFGAGSVTDLSGDGANEAFSITYHGSYVPEIDPSSNVIYRNDFSDGVASMLLYEGDHNTPSAEMAYYKFDADNTPWMPVTDEKVINYAAASHSSYDPAGKSDDWMVTPQLFLPDDKATLSFKSQSMKAEKKDVLKVYVWPSEEVVTMLTPSIVDKIRYNGDLVYSQEQNPGASEDDLAGDWRDNTVDLSKYEGKYLYIAFVNDNQNQSAIFVDDVLVTREVAAILSIDTSTAMADADETVIKGRFIVKKEGGLDGYTITLREAGSSDAQPLSVITSEKHLDKDEMCAFEFPKPVVLRKGGINDFDISFTSGDNVIGLRHSIKNLLFSTTKRVVLEEYTGTTCQFCPLGIIAAEYLTELYGDRFIPIAIHSYSGDSFGGPEPLAYSSFFGLVNAPSGVVCRGSISNPMYSENGDYVFSSADGRTWLQNIENAMQQLTEADVNIKDVHIDADLKKVNVDMDVNFAVDRSNANINIFGVIMEDGLFGLQSNGLHGTQASGLKDWGKGGAYGQARVAWYYDDVVRGTSAVATNGLYTGFNGKGGYVPAEISAGENMEISFDFNLPSNISDLSKTKVCVMLIDSATGEYINAAVSGADNTAVEGIDADSVESADVYDLTGRIVLRNASVEDLQSLDKGIYVRAGKKFAVH